MDSPDVKPTDAYPLQRSFLASVRLYYQYWMIRRQFGHLVHPAMSVREDAMIADVACGTSIWALDVAKQYPNANSHGFDISAEQYPHLHWRPRNVTLGTLDLLKPIPEHLRGKYDIVHVGVVVCIVENSDPSAFPDNILLLLKPGGHLQWDDLDIGAMYTNTPDANASPCPALSQLANRVIPETLKTWKENLHWVHELDETFKQQGMKVLDFKDPGPDDDIGLPWTYNLVMAIAEVISQTAREPQVVKEWWDVHARASEEVTQGATLRMKIISAVGQRPS